LLSSFKKTFSADSSIISLPTYTIYERSDISPIAYQGTSLGQSAKQMSVEMTTNK